MSGVAVLTYHPEIALFAKPGQPPRKGAWRVSRFMPWGGASDKPVLIKVGHDYSMQGRALFIDSPRRLRVGTYVNPTKLLRELLATRRTA